MALVQEHGCEEEVAEHDLPPRHELAAVWEESICLRSVLRKNGRLFKPELTGVPTLRAMALNKTVLLDCLSVWAPYGKAKPPPINWLREEAG